MQGKETKFGTKYVNREKNHIKDKWINNNPKELQELKENENSHGFTQSNTEKYQIDGIHGYWFKNSFLSTTDWQLKWINA